MGFRRGVVLSDDDDCESFFVAEGSSSRQKRRSPKYKAIQEVGGICSTSGKQRSEKRLKKATKGRIAGSLNGSSDNEYILEDCSGFLSGDQQKYNKRKKKRFCARYGRSNAGSGKPIKSSEEAIEKSNDEVAFEPERGIEVIDIPERLINIDEIGKHVSLPEDWAAEANWIYDRLIGNLSLMPLENEFKFIVDVEREEIIQEIIFVLKELHEKHYEVPFIGTYRYYGCAHLMCKDDKSSGAHPYGEKNGVLNPYEILWRLFHLHRKWILLCYRKQQLEETYKKHLAVQELDDGGKDVINEILGSLQAADSEQVIDDIDAKFSLHFPPEQMRSLGLCKRPKQHSYYILCCKSGFGKLSKQFNITPRQLCENLCAEKKIHEPPSVNVCPEDVDLTIVSGHFIEVQCALRGAKHIAAYEMSCEPKIRQYVRDHCSQHMVVCTRLTDKGRNDLGSLPEWSCVKSMQEKPVSNLCGGEWMFVQMAEVENCLEVKIYVPQTFLYDEVMRPFEENYLSSDSSAIEKMWNEQRKEILKEAVLDMILPVLVNETRILLTVKAKAWIQSECSSNLWKRMFIAPYCPGNYSSNHNFVSRLGIARVLACCWGFRNPSTTFVMLDPLGKMMDTLQTGYLNLPFSCTGQQQQRRNEDQQRLQKFILKYKPDVIIVGASLNTVCKFLKNAIIDTLAKAVVEDPELSSVSVMYGDESIASLFERSQASIAEMPKEAGIVRRAVALGRNLQNPLAVVASLCGPSKDIVSLNLHSMQKFLTEDEIYSTIEEVMVSVTNLAGVDVNLAVEQEWHFPTLQFVSGLGPQKACFLKNLIQKLRWLPHREKLRKRPYSFCNTIFTNCSGFLRIYARTMGPFQNEVELLDDTRIHPESYKLAKDLAINAILKNPPMLSDTEVDLSQKAIECIRESPDLLKEEDVLKYLSLQKGTREVRIEVLNDIRVELISGFKDVRASPCQMGSSWLIGDNEINLAIGKAVNVTVLKVLKHCVICILELGIRGILEKEDFTGADLTTLISEGSSLRCQISGINEDQYIVQLRCIENDFTSEDAQITDDSSRIMPASESVAETGGTKKKGKSQYSPREISHDLFQNTSAEDAVKALKEKDGVEVVFYPSSKGLSWLSMTFKLHDTILVYKDIMELEKDTQDMASFSRLGKLLKIDGRTYSNLDEVVSSYISPLLSKLKEVQASRNFCNDDNEVPGFFQQVSGSCMENLLYCLSLSRNSPGTITISYLINGNMKQDKIYLYPEGYGFQDKMFRRIETVIHYLSQSVTTMRMFNEYNVHEKNRGRSRGRGRGRGRGRQQQNEENEDGKFSYWNCNNEQQRASENGGKDGWWTSASDDNKQESMLNNLWSSTTDCAAQNNNWEDTGKAASGWEENLASSANKEWDATNGRGIDWPQDEQTAEGWSGWNTNGIDTRESESGWGDERESESGKIVDPSQDDQKPADRTGGNESGTNERESKSGWGVDPSEDDQTQAGCTGWNAGGTKKLKSNSGWGDDGSEREHTSSGWKDCNAGRTNEQESKSGWGNDVSEHEHTSSGWNDWNVSRTNKQESKSGWGDDGSDREHTSSGWKDCNAGRTNERESKCGWGDDVSEHKHTSSGWNDWNAGRTNKQESKSGWGDDESEREHTSSGWKDCNGGRTNEQESKSGWGDDASEHKHTSSGWNDWNAGRTNKQESKSRWGGDASEHERTSSGWMDWNAGGNKGESDSGWGSNERPTWDGSQKSEWKGQGDGLLGKYSSSNERPTWDGSQKSEWKGQGDGLLGKYSSSNERPTWVGSEKSEWKGQGDGLLGRPDFKRGGFGGNRGRSCGMKYNNEGTEVWNQFGRSRGNGRGFNRGRGRGRRGNSNSWPQNGGRGRWDSSQQGNEGDLRGTETRCLANEGGSQLTETRLVADEGNSSWFCNDTDGCANQSEKSAQEENNGWDDWARKEDKGADQKADDGWG